MITSRVYELRREGNTEEAYSCALNIYQRYPEDDDAKKALSWTLIDLCKKHLSENNLNQAKIFFDQLSDIEFDYEDSFIETINKQIKSLRPKIDIHFAIIQQAEDLSKSGQHKKALDLMKSMVANNQLSELNHEAYGWVIYRYIKAELNTASSVEIRTLLRDYMNLKNDRPSLLHSMILNFGLNYSKEHLDFNLFNFLKLWDPKNFRDEDKKAQNIEGKEVSSLISRICREFIDKDSLIEIEYLIENIAFDSWTSRISQKEQVLDLLREPYFWNLFHTHKDNKFNDLWNLFVKYNATYSEFGKSKYHSEVLSLAERFMKEDEEWRFLDFFTNWEPQNLRDEDWIEPTKEGKTYNSLAVKCYTKAFNIALNKNKQTEAFQFLEGINSERHKIQVIDVLRERSFWILYNVHKENRYNDLWNLFDKYNETLSSFGRSKHHSDVLSLAERFMIEKEEWRFLNFFKQWNSSNFTEDDWKEVVKEENTYKPLAIKSIKKAFDIIKNQEGDVDLVWLIQTYEKAIKLFPNDEWILREKALLHIRIKDFDSAIKIYKQLVLELSDKYYVWHEFSNCFDPTNRVKIGMLSKALLLEKNEDFLGDVHLELANAFIQQDLIENASFELKTYKDHREKNSWKLSPIFEVLNSRIGVINSNLKSNTDLYEQFIPFAEGFAYSDFSWTEVVLIDKWKDNSQKERLTFTNGNSIEFSIGGKRFRELKQGEIGQVFNFKLHKHEIKREIEPPNSWMKKTIITEFKYIPLIFEKTNKANWSILEDTFAVIDYINNEKNIIHAITFDNKEIFFPQLRKQLEYGDFIKAKYYYKKVKDDLRLELQQIIKVNPDDVIDRFQHKIAIVDGINEEKQLFHFVIDKSLQGIIRYSETIIRPNEGDFIRIHLVTKTDKQKKLRIRVLKIELSDETSPTLKKDISGILKVKNKMSSSIFDFDDFEIDDADEFKVPEKFENEKPDFAFIEDYYVSKQLLEKNKITKDCLVNAIVIFCGDKWKVTEIVIQEGNLSISNASNNNEY